jgi:uncharacterized membrane protein
LDAAIKKHASCQEDLQKLTADATSTWYNFNMGIPCLVALGILLICFVVGIIFLIRSSQNASNELAAAHLGQLGQHSLQAANQALKRENFFLKQKNEDLINFTERLNSQGLEQRNAYQNNIVSVADKARDAVKAVQLQGNQYLRQRNEIVDIIRKGLDNLRGQSYEGVPQQAATAIKTYLEKILEYAQEIIQR